MTKPIDELIFDYTANQTNPFYTHFSYQQAPLRAFIERVTTLEYAINQYQFPIIQQSLNQYLAQHLFTSIMANLECFLRYFFSGVLYLTRYTTNPTLNSSHHNDAFKTTTDYNYISTNLISVDKVEIFNKVTDRRWSVPDQVNLFFKIIELDGDSKPFFNFNTYTKDTLKNLWQIRHANGHISGILTENDVGKLSTPTTMLSFSSFIVNTDLIKELIQFLIKILDEEVKNYESFFKSKMKSELTDTEKQEIDMFFSTLKRDTMHNFYFALSKMFNKNQINQNKKIQKQNLAKFELCQMDGLYDAYINSALIYESVFKDKSNAIKLYKELENQPFLTFHDELEIARFYSTTNDKIYINKTKTYADKCFNKKSNVIQIIQDLEDIFTLLTIYKKIEIDLEHISTSLEDIQNKIDSIFNQIINYIKTETQFTPKKHKIYLSIFKYFESHLPCVPNSSNRRTINNDEFIRLIDAFTNLNNKNEWSESLLMKNINHIYKIHEPSKPTKDD